MRLSTGKTGDDLATHSRVEQAIERVRPTMQADGFDLTLQEVNQEGAAHVILKATKEACLDCLVPDEMLVGILEREIRSEEPAVSKVVLHKTNFPEM